MNASSTLCFSPLPLPSHPSPNTLLAMAFPTLFTGAGAVHKPSRTHTWEKKHYSYNMQSSIHPHDLYDETWASLACSPPGRSKCSKPSCASCMGGRLKPVKGQSIDRLRWSQEIHSRCVKSAGTFFPRVLKADSFV